MFRCGEGAEGQPVPLLPLHPAGAVGPDHAGLVASASNTPHLVPTATLFAAGMGTPLPSGIIHPAGDYDSSLGALSSTALSTSVETSTSTSTSSPSSTTSSSNTSALVLGSISEVKSELAEVKDELSAVHLMQTEMREMKRRLGQLEEDNASLKGTVIELRTQVGGGGGGARFGQFRVEAAGGQQGPPLKKIRWMGHEALSPEMLWCFPFLEHINISRSNFVVDDLEYVPHATHDTQHDTHDTRHTTHDTRHTTHDTRHTTHTTHTTKHNTTRNTRQSPTMRSSLLRYVTAGRRYWCCRSIRASGPRARPLPTSSSATCRASPSYATHSSLLS